MPAPAEQLQLLAEALAASFAGAEPCGTVAGALRRLVPGLQYFR